MTRGIPATLDGFLDARVPQFDEMPDEGWFEDVAEIYGATLEHVREEFQWRHAALLSSPPPQPFPPRQRPTLEPVARVDPRDGRHPYDRVVAALHARGGRVAAKQDPHGREAIRATCPAHADAKPSLVVTRDGAVALVRCFGGCPTAKVVAALGLRMADLFPRGARLGRSVVATYDYHTLDGRLVGRKVRYAPKSFRWRQYSAEVGPYRLPDLIDARVVVLVEGERAAERLWSQGIAATCGPAGASSWRPEWSRSLWLAGCRELVIVPDDDAAGRAFAERVASVTCALDVDEPMVVRVVTLPLTRAGDDLVDWLDAGHAGDELEVLAAQTVPWTPEGAALAHERTRKALRAARNRRYREKRRGAVRPDIRASQGAAGGNRDIRASHIGESGAESGAPDIRASPLDGLGETLRRETRENVLLCTSQGVSSDPGYVDLSVPVPGSSAEVEETHVRGGDDGG